MRRLSFIFILAGFCALVSLSNAQEETLTITTYYPSPYGVYREMRAQRMAIGDDYIQGSYVCWQGDTGCSGSPMIPSTNNVDLIVQGNVGIGTTSPEVKLEIVDTNTEGSNNNIRLFPVDTYENAGISLITTGTPDAASHNDSSYIQFRIADQLPSRLWYLYNPTKSINGLGLFTSYVPGSGFTTARLYIDGVTGNVGIGTTSPGGRLEVVNENPVHGSIIFGCSVNDVHFDGGPDSAFVFENTGPSGDGYTLFVGGGLHRLVIKNNGNVGIGTMGPNYKLDVRGTIGNDTTLYHSDARWKKNVETIPGALDKVLRLRGVSFVWRQKEYRDMDFASGQHIGLIAQEVEKVVPEVVTTSKDGYKSVEYANLVALLTEAIKEQQQQIQDLKQEVSKLKGNL